MSLEAILHRYSKPPPLLLLLMLVQLLELQVLDDRLRLRAFKSHRTVAKGSRASCTVHG